MSHNKLKVDQLNKLIVIVGPTASGKTNLAIELAKKYNGEIICADSRTIYRYMDVGTAKPTLDEQQSVPHHLLDIVDPNIHFSVVEFKTLCNKTIEDIQDRGKLPIMVGGSGMYIDSVLFDYQFRSQNSNIDISGMSLEEKQQKALSLYPSEIMQIDVKNERRVDQLLQRGPSQSKDRESLKKECKIIGLSIKTPLLKQNIESRTKQMLNNGIVQETKKIIRIFGNECPALNTIGYKQVASVMDGEVNEKELENAINRATIGLAKRQITWFKRNKAIVWVDSTMNAKEVAKSYLQKK